MVLFKIGLWQKTKWFLQMYVEAMSVNLLSCWLKFFFLYFGPSGLTSIQLIQYHGAGFYKPTIPQSPPSNLRDYSTCNNARLEFSTIFAPSFDPNEWCLKNGLQSGGFNPGPLGHESSALTTRPQLLAKADSKFIFSFNILLFLHLLFLPLVRS